MCNKSQTIRVVYLHPLYRGRELTDEFEGTLEDVMQNLNRAGVESSAIVEVKALSGEL